MKMRTMPPLLAACLQPLCAAAANPIGCDAMTLNRVDAAPAAPSAPAADPTGLWKWTVMRPGSDQPIEISASLTFADGKLAGTYHGRGGDTPITDASLKDGAIAFSVVRERDGNQFVIKYAGTLAGDAITGTILLPGFDGGASSTIDWKATRSK
jgi:hypothetical protein